MYTNNKNSYMMGYGGNYNMDQRGNFNNHNNCEEFKFCCTCWDSERINHNQFFARQNSREAYQKDFDDKNNSECEFSRINGLGCFVVQSDWDKESDYLGSNDKHDDGRNSYSCGSWRWEKENKNNHDCKEKCEHNKHSSKRCCICDLFRICR